MCRVSFENWKKFEANIVRQVFKSNMEIQEDGEERYQCDLCDRSYKHKTSLFAHSMRASPSDSHIYPSVNPQLQHDVI
jgi:hypothetical protein